MILKRAYERLEGLDQFKKVELKLVIAYISDTCYGIASYLKKI